MVVFTTAFIGWIISLPVKVKRTTGFMFNGNSVYTICYCIHCCDVKLLSHCFSETNDPLEMTVVPFLSKLCTHTS